MTRPLLDVRPEVHGQPVEHVAALLRSMGFDVTSNALRDTPARVARALIEMTRGYYVETSDFLTTFSDSCNEMVICRGIEFASLCEHHLLPFTGRAAVGYIPNGTVVGLSKMPRLVEMYARRLQLQERMTREIADALDEALTPIGVAVVVEATHQCMSCRGVEQRNASMVTSVFRGALHDEPAARAEFLALARL